MQLELFEHTLVIPESVLNHKAFKDWNVYHQSNPIIYRNIISELRKAHRKGLKASVKAIINALRWSIYLNSGQQYKINDKYTGIYTHVIKANHPEFSDMIESRELRSLS